MIKSGLAKNIIFGLIFSIIFGFMGNYLYKKLNLKDETVWYKKIYVLGTSKNVIFNKFGNLGIPNYNSFISDQYFSSLKYNLLYFQKTNAIKLCKTITIQMVDFSIIFETGRFVESEDELVSSCLSEVILKSFDRFKAKTITVVEDAILLKQLTLKKLRLEALEKEKRILKKTQINIEKLKKKKQIVEQKTRENKLEKEKRLIELKKKRLVKMQEQKKKNSSRNELEKSFCDNIDILFKNALVKAGIDLKDDKKKDKKVENIKDLNYLLSLSKECNRDPDPLYFYRDFVALDAQTLDLDNDIMRSEIESFDLDSNISQLEEVYSQINADTIIQINAGEINVINNQINEINNQINEIQEFFSSSKLEDLFYLKKDTFIDEKQRNQIFLTQIQTLITFSILGFIVGFILSSNFLAVLKGNK